MNRAGILLLLAIAGCSSTPESPDTVTEASAEEQTLDPHKAGRELIDTREQEGHLDRAVRVLEWHAARKPDDAKLQILATEAYSRSLEALGDDTSGQKARVQRLLSKGKPHADAALKLEPSSGEAHYWAACLLLHQADYDKSLGEAKQALALLDKAEAAAPKIDDGGPARMKGRVLQEMPALFGGSLSKAVASYKKSLQAAPDCITTHLWLGEAYADGKQPELARKELEWVVAAKPRPGHEKEDGADIKKAEEKLKSLKP